MAKKQPPEFQLLWDAYPHADDSDAVRKEIGGAVDNPDYENTCAIRLSRALNYAGQPVQAAANLYTVKGADKKRYALRMKELTTYLKAQWGAPQVTAKSPNGSTEKFDGKKGVISFLSIPGYSGGGHIDLWDGARTAHGQYFESAEVLLWTSPEPEPEEEEAEEAGSLGATGASAGGAAGGTSGAATAGPVVGEEVEAASGAPPPEDEPEADLAEDLATDEHADAEGAPSATAGERTFFLPPDETITAEYEVLSQPPPADSATATVYRHRLGGDVIETKTLVNQGASTLQLPLTSYVIGDSPLFVSFVFEKADSPNPRVEVPRAYSLAQAAPWGLTAATDARPDTAFAAEVSDWGALAYDAPGQATPFAGLDASRVSQAAKDAVKWRADGVDLTPTGATAQLTLGAAAVGHAVLIEAYVGDTPPGYASIRVAVPALQVRAEDGEHVAPAIVDKGARVTVKGVSTPNVPGTWSWSTESDKVTLTPTAGTDLCVIEGVTKTEEGEQVTIKAKLTSGATSNEYEVELQLAVRELVVELFFQRSPSYSEGDDRGIAQLDWRIRSGPGDADVYANGTTEADGLITAQVRGTTCFVDWLVSGAAVATYQITVREGDYEAVATPIGKQRRLRTLGYHLGTAGPDGNGVDGDMGRRTDRAYLEFQGEIGDDMTGNANAHFQSELEDYVGTAPAAAPAAT